MHSRTKLHVSFALVAAAIFVSTPFAPPNVRAQSPASALAQATAAAQAAAGSPAASPQDPNDPLPSFEVASIKPSATDGHVTMMGMSPGGRYRASGVTVKLLIMQAYDLKDFQISGGPGWMTSERYDIVAKAETNVKPDQIKLMLRSLLAERFKLNFHGETKEVPVYNLVVAKNGPKLKRSENQPDAQAKAPVPPPSPVAHAGGGAGAGVVGGMTGGMAGGAWNSSVSRSGPGGPEGPGGPGGPRRGAMIRMGRGQMTAQQASIATLVANLSMQLGRPVIDKTGLQGTFDFELRWTPDETQRGFGLGEARPETESVPGDSGPSIFAALQEQLGLKLESQKGSVEILVIHGVEKPAED